MTVGETIRTGEPRSTQLSSFYVDSSSWCSLSQFRVIGHLFLIPEMDAFINSTTVAATIVVGGAVLTALFSTGKKNLKNQKLVLA